MACCILEQGLPCFFTWALKVTTFCTCRKNSRELERLVSRPAAKFTLFHKDSALVEIAETKEERSHKYKWFHMPGPLAQFEHFMEKGIGHVFLGLDQDQNPHFALPIEEDGLAEIKTMVESAAEVHKNAPVSYCVPVPGFGSVYAWMRSSSFCLSIAIRRLASFLELHSLKYSLKLFCTKHAVLQQ